MNDQQRSAMQMAHDLLCRPIDTIAEMYCFGMGDCDEARAALREALAQPQETTDYFCGMCGSKPCSCLDMPMPTTQAAQPTVNDCLTVQKQGEPVAFLAEATRFKVCMTDHACMITGLPMELGGRWVALVAAEDDCHLRYTAPPSVEIPKLGRAGSFGD